MKTSQRARIRSESLLRRCRPSSILDERGNVESALVLIPLMFLFLSGLQLALAVHIRNSDQIQIQGEASARAISGELTSGDEVVSISRGWNSPDLVMITSHMRRSIPTLIPGLNELLGRALESEVTGVAIIEESR